MKRRTIHEIEESAHVLTTIYKKAPEQFPYLFVKDHYVETATSCIMKGGVLFFDNNTLLLGELERIPYNISVIQSVTLVFHSIVSDTQGVVDAFKKWAYDAGANNMKIMDYHHKDSLPVQNRKELSGWIMRLI